MKKIKKSVYLVMALLLAGIGFATYKVVAWLTDTGTSGKVDFTVGEVKYTWGGELISNSNKVVPGQPLIDEEFTLTNGSNVDSQLRVKIELSVSPLKSGDTVSDLVAMTLGDNWHKDGDYYYYADAVGNAQTYKILATDTTPIDVITALSLEGSKVGNFYAGATFSITLTFEAKQEAYVTWAQLGTANIDFGTGLVKVEP